MRTLCDGCESAAAIVFCAADEAALCRACDEKFPGNKPGNIEEPASQPVDPGENGRGQNQPVKPTVGENQQKHKVSPVKGMGAKADGHLKTDTKMIDLNVKPHRTHRMHGQASNNQEQ